MMIKLSDNCPNVTILELIYISSQCQCCMLRVVTKGGPRVNRMGVNLDNRVIGSRIFIFGGAFYSLYPLLLGSPGYLLFAAKYLNNTGLRLRLSRVKIAAGFWQYLAMVRRIRERRSWLFWNTYFILFRRHNFSVILLSSEMYLKYDSQSFPFR